MDWPQSGNSSWRHLRWSTSNWHCWSWSRSRRPWIFECYTEWFTSCRFGTLIVELAQLYVARYPNPKFHLGCCNIGAAGNNLTWDDMPRLWPNFCQLTIGATNKSLTVEKVLQLITRFEKLIKINLPQEMLGSNEQIKMARELATELLQNERGTVLLYNQSHVFGSCPVIA